MAKSVVPQRALLVASALTMQSCASRRERQLRALSSSDNRLTSLFKV